MPSIPLDDSSFELRVRFRLNNVQEFFDVPAGSPLPKTRKTETFGEGWSIQISRQSESGDDCGLGVFLWAPAKWSSQQVTISIRLESLTGQEYFYQECSNLYSSGEGYGWPNILTRADDWEDDENLRTENAIIINATVRTSTAPLVDSKPLLEFIHQSIADKHDCYTRFITFSRRTDSGHLSCPRTFAANDNVMEGTSDYLLRYFTIPDTKSNLMHFLEDGQTEKALTSIASTYVDEDSDFEDEDSDFKDEEKSGSKSEEDVDLVEGEVPEQEVQGPSDPNEIPDIGGYLASSHSDDMQIDASDPGALTMQAVDSDETLKGTELADNCLDAKGANESAEDVDSSDDNIIDTYVVTGVASRTWEALLFYLYTGNIKFAPLKSEGEGVRRSFIDKYLSEDSDRPAPCSCKSMYRLADEMGLDTLKGLALQHLRTRLSAQNTLVEMFSVFTSRYSEVKKIEMDALAEHWHKLNDTPVLMGKFMELTNGSYPHATWVLTEWFQKLAPSPTQ